MFLESRNCSYWLWWGKLQGSLVMVKDGAHSLLDIPKVPSISSSTFFSSTTTHESHYFEKIQMQEIQKCQMRAASEVGSMQFGAPDLYFLYVWLWEKIKLMGRWKTPWGCHGDYWHHPSPSLCFPGTSPIKVSNYSSWTLTYR